VVLREQMVGTLHSAHPTTGFIFKKKKRKEKENCLFSG
jgi:hypothetical protein